MADRKITQQVNIVELMPSPPSQSFGRARRIPIFSRLGVKHGIIIVTLVLLAMTAITTQQLSETISEIKRSAVDKGRAVGSAVAPLVSASWEHRDALAGYFKRIASAKNHIDYVQLVDYEGRVSVSNILSESAHTPHPLEPGWLRGLDNKIKLDRSAVPQEWQSGGGVDVFVVVLHDPENASVDDIEHAPHLRIGVNFDNIVQQDTPRLIWRMVVFTLIVAAIMLIGLLLLLGYILRPLRELHKGLIEVSHGNLEYQVPVYSHDEVGRVVQAFNATLARLRAAFEQIEELATRDPLTSLLNRRLFDERLATQSAMARRYRRPFGVIVMDLDKFKDVNDQYGHPAGDEVLKAVARIIEATVRETDLAARIGGEEFAVILPETGADEVKGVAEKLRAAVESACVSPKHGLPEGFHITLSGGAVCSAGHLVTSEAVMATADAALYKSKAEGRNRITMTTSTGAGKSNLMDKTPG